MISLQEILNSSIVNRIGFALMHSVWQCTVAAVLFAVVMFALRKRRAAVRYNFAFGALLLMVMLPVLTFLIVRVETEKAGVHTKAPVSSQMSEETVETSAVGNELAANARGLFFQSDWAAEPGDAEDAEDAVVAFTAEEEIVDAESYAGAESAGIFGKIDAVLGHFAIAWIVGVSVLSIWHLGGWAQLRRLRRTMIKPVQKHVVEKVQRLCGLMGVNRAFEIVESALVTVPTVIGAVKPMVLLPASALTGLSGEQLEMILAHELGHIKRNDYLLNLIQTAIDILLFYHPAAWYVSSVIRTERENCCDDIAVGVTGDNVKYARALATLEEIKSENRRLAVAATGGNFFDRVARLVGKEESSKSKPAWQTVVITMLVVGAVVMPLCFAISGDKGGAETGQADEETKIEDKSDQPEYKVILPNGVEVELIALCSGRSEEDRTWWLPDGQVVDDGRYDKYNKDVNKVELEDKPGKQQFKYCYLYRTIPAGDVTVKSGVSGGIDWHGRFSKDNTTIGYVYSSTADYDDFPQTGSIKIAAAAGGYKEKVRKLHKGSINDATVLTDRKTNISISGPRTYAEYSEQLLDVSITSNQYDIKVVCQLMDGKEIEARPEGSMGGPHITSFVTKLNPMIRHSFRVSGNWDKIKNFIIKYRKLEVATFGDVSLKPGHKTELTVSDGQGVTESGLLDTQIDFSGITTETTFEEAFAFIREKVPAISVVVMWKDLSENAFIERGSPVGVDGIGKTSLRNGLDVILRSVSEPVSLKYVYKEGILTIMSGKTFDYFENTLTTGEQSDRSCEKQLNSNVDFSFIEMDTTFKEVIDNLRSRNPGLSIAVQWNNLSSAFVDKENIVGFDGLGKTSLRNGLELILKSVGGSLTKMAYSCKEGLIVIGTQEENKSESVPEIETKAEPARIQKLDFVDNCTVLRAVQILSEFFKKNIVLSDEISKRETVNVKSLYNVSFEEALQAVIGENKFVKEGNLIKVYTPEQYAGFYKFDPETALAKLIIVKDTFKSVFNGFEAEEPEGDSILKEMKSVKPELEYLVNCTKDTKIESLAAQFLKQTDEVIQQLEKGNTKKARILDEVFGELGPRLEEALKKAAEEKKEAASLIESKVKTLEPKNTSIKFGDDTTVLRAIHLLGEVFKKNIVLSGINTKAPVTVKYLYDVSFEEALEAVIGENKFAKEGNTIKVYTPEEYSELYGSDGTVSQKPDAATSVETTGPVGRGASGRKPGDADIKVLKIQSIRFAENSTVANALNALSQMYKKNIVPSGKVDTKRLITVSNLYDVTFEEALQAVIGGNKFVKEGNLIKVYTPEEYAELYEFDPETAFAKLNTIKGIFGAVKEPLESEEPDVDLILRNMKSVKPEIEYLVNSTKDTKYESLAAQFSKKSHEVIEQLEMGNIEKAGILFEAFNHLGPKLEESLEKAVEEKEKDVSEIEAKDSAAEGSKQKCVTLLIGDNEAFFEGKSIESMEEILPAMREVKDRENTTLEVFIPVKDLPDKDWKKIKTFIRAWGKDAGFKDIIFTDPGDESFEPAKVSVDEDTKYATLIATQNEGYLDGKKISSPEETRNAMMQVKSPEEKVLQVLTEKEVVDREDWFLIKSLLIAWSREAGFKGIVFNNINDEPVKPHGNKTSKTDEHIKYVTFIGKEDGAYLAGKKIESFEDISPMIKAIDDRNNTVLQVVLTEASTKRDDWNLIKNTLAAYVREHGLKGIVFTDMDESSKASAVEPVSGVNQVRRYVRLVGVEDGVMIDGKLYEGLGEIDEAFSGMEDKSGTVIEWGFAPGEMPEDKKSMGWLGIAYFIGELEKLVEKHGFAGICFAGELAVDSKKVSFPAGAGGSFALDKEVDLDIKSGPIELKSIKFVRKNPKLEGAAFKALINSRVTSWPKRKIEIRLELSTGGAENQRYAVYKTFENSGVIKGVAAIGSRVIEIPFADIADAGFIKDVERFEIRVREIEKAISNTVEEEKVPGTLLPMSREKLIGLITASEQKIRDIELHMVCRVIEDGWLFFDYDWGYESGKEFISGTSYSRDRLGQTTSEERTKTFDGKTYYSYYERPEDDKIRKSGTIADSDNMGFGGYLTFNMLMGYSSYGYNRASLSEILAGADSVTVKSKPEKIDGHLCYVVDVVNCNKNDVSGRVYNTRLWLDAERDLRLLKREQYFDKDKRSEYFKGLKWRLDNIKLAKVDGVWLPVEGERSFYKTEKRLAEGVTKEEFAKLSEEQQRKAIVVETAVDSIKARRLTIDPASIRLNKGIADKRFTIDFPEGCEVYDYRKDIVYVVGEASEKESAYDDQHWVHWAGELSVDELIGVLRETKELSGVGRKKVFAAIDRLVRLKSAAVEPVGKELVSTDSSRMQSYAGLILRAIGDPEAVPYLINGLEMSLKTSDLGLGFGEGEDSLLEKAYRRYQYKRSGSGLGLCRPVREITYALEKLTGHSEGHDHFDAYDSNGRRLGSYTVTPEIVERQRTHRKRVADRWRKWWQSNKDEVLAAYSAGRLPKKPVDPETKSQTGNGKDVKGVLTHQGAELCFAIVPNIGIDREPSLTKQQYQNYVEDLKANGPVKSALRGESFQWSRINENCPGIKTLPVQTYKNEKYVLLCAGKDYVLRPEFEGKQIWGLKNAEVVKDSTGRSAVNVQFDAEGCMIVHRFTSRNVGNRMAIEAAYSGLGVVSAPIIEQPIERRATINGNFTEQEAKGLAELLKKGMVKSNVLPDSSDEYEPLLDEGNSNPDNNTDNSGIEFSDSEISQQPNQASGEKLFDLKYADPRNFIELEWSNGMHYMTAKRLIKAEKLPLLYEMLEDKNYAPSWHKVARLIGIVSQDPCSVPMLLDYFQRDDRWNWKDKKNGMARIAGKISSLIWIGKIGGSDADAILREAVTEKGALQLANAWIEGELLNNSKSYGNKENVVTLIRGHAAKGLAYSGNPENIDIVKQLYTKEDAYCRENKTVTNLYNGLVDAMAAQGFIAANGREALFETYGEINRSLELIGPYIFEYAWHLDENLTKAKAAEILSEFISALEVFDVDSLENLLADADEKALEEFKRMAMLENRINRTSPGIKKVPLIVYKTKTAGGRYRVLSLVRSGGEASHHMVFYLVDTDHGFKVDFDLGAYLQEMRGARRLSADELGEKKSKEQRGRWKNAEGEELVKLTAEWLQKLRDIIIAGEYAAEHEIEYCGFGSEGVEDLKGELDKFKKMTPEEIREYILKEIDKMSNKSVKIRAGEAGDFSDVKEIVIGFGASAGTFIDFDTVKKMEMPEPLSETGNKQEFIDWIGKTGADASVKVVNGMCYIGLTDSFAWQVDNDKWKTITPQEILGSGELSDAKLGYGNITKKLDELPRTYIFKTGQGGMGIFRVSKFKGKPAGVKISFKAIKKPKNTNANLRELPDKIVFTVVDKSGTPVSGAAFGNYFYFHGLGKDNKPRFMWSKPENKTTDDKGRIILGVDDLFKKSWPGDLKTRLSVYDESRKLGYQLKIARNDLTAEMTITLSSVCRVRGSFIYEGYDEKAYPNSKTSYELVREGKVVTNNNSDSNDFDFLLFAGRYHINAGGFVYNNKVSLQAGGKVIEFEINEGQKELNLGRINLQAGNIVSLVGRGAPEIGRIKSWHNGRPVKLSDLKGKTVLLHFGGSSASVSNLNELANLHKKFADHGLEIIAVYKSTDMATLQQKWQWEYEPYTESLRRMEEVHKAVDELCKKRGIDVPKRSGPAKLYGPKQVPFRVAFEGGGESPQESTYSAYGISGRSCIVVIDKEGKVAGNLILNNAEEAIARLLGVELPNDDELKPWHEVPHRVRDENLALSGSRPYEYAEAI